MLDSIFPSIPSILTITFIGLFFGLVLSVAKLKLAVEKDPRYEELLRLLPGANCGSCGYPGCAGYAHKIIEAAAPVNKCPGIDNDTIKKISELMGVEAVSKVPMKARMHCQGGNKEAVIEFLYNGPQNCAAANQIMGGFKVCQYGCLGLGDCAVACPFDAVSMNENGLPSVDIEKCTGCGICINECPRNIISLVREDINVHIMCRNKEKAAVMKKGCSAGCIACKKCVKVCEEVFSNNSAGSAIDVIDFLAVIDYKKCINCGKCAEACPKNVIKSNKVLTQVN